MYHVYCYYGSGASRCTIEAKSAKEAWKAYSHRMRSVVAGFNRLIQRLDIRVDVM